MIGQGFGTRESRTEASFQLGTGQNQIIREKDMKALGKEFDEEGYEVKV